MTGAAGRWHRSPFLRRTRCGNGRRRQHAARRRRRRPTLGERRAEHRHPRVERRRRSPIFPTGSASTTQHAHHTVPLHVAGRRGYRPRRTACSTCCCRPDRARRSTAPSRRAQSARARCRRPPTLCGERRPNRALVAVDPAGGSDRHVPDARRARVRSHHHHAGARRRGDHHARTAQRGLGIRAHADIDVPQPVDVSWNTEADGTQLGHGRLLRSDATRRCAATKLDGTAANGPRGDLSPAELLTPPALPGPDGAIRTRCRRSPTSGPVRACAPSLSPRPLGRRSVMRGITASRTTSPQMS